MTLDGSLRSATDVGNEVLEEGISLFKIYMKREGAVDEELPHS